AKRQGDLQVGGVFLRRPAARYHQGLSLLVFERVQRPRITGRKSWKRRACRHLSQKRGGAEDVLSEATSAPGERARCRGGSPTGKRRRRTSNRPTSPRSLPSRTSAPAARRRGFA